MRRIPALDVKRESLVLESRLIRKKEKQQLTLAAKIRQLRDTIACLEQPDPLAEAVEPGILERRASSAAELKRKLQRLERTSIGDHGRAKLSDHRRNEVRSESRATMLAIACLRGKPYAQIEPGTSLTEKQFINLMTRVRTLVRRYGARWSEYPTDPEAIAEREEAIRAEDTATKLWLAEAGACYRNRVTGM